MPDKISYYDKKILGICLRGGCQQKATYSKFCYNHWIYRIYHSIKNRCGNPDKHLKDAAYAKIKLLMTYAEFKKWALENKPKCKRPSIERIDSKKHYEISNIKWLELYLNIRHKGCQQGIPEGKYLCPQCARIFPRTAKYFHRRRNLLHSICKDCNNDARDRRRGTL